jgi:hypothetical protein
MYECDYDGIEQVYRESILGQFKTIKRTNDPRGITIEVDDNGAIRLMDISDWLFQKTGGGREFFNVWSVRKMDKIDKKTNTIISKKGDEVTLKCKLGRCDRDDKGIGSTSGNPMQRYDKYGNITVCADRGEIDPITGKKKGSTRNFWAPGVSKVIIDHIEYRFTNPRSPDDPAILSVFAK